MDVRPKTEVTRNQEAGPTRALGSQPTDKVELPPDGFDNHNAARGAAEQFNKGASSTHALPRLRGELERIASFGDAKHMGVYKRELTGQVYGKSKMASLKEFQEMNPAEFKKAIEDWGGKEIAGKPEVEKKEMLGKLAALKDALESKEPSYRDRFSDWFRGLFSKSTENRYDNYKNSMDVLTKKLRENDNP